MKNHLLLFAFIFVNCTFSFAKENKKKKPAPEPLSKSFVLSFDDMRKENIRFENLLKEFNLPPTNIKVFFKKSNGDLVGNGAGLFEGQAYYFLYSLDRIISAALNEKPEIFSEKETYFLQQILDQYSYFENKTQLIFLNSHEYPGFFKQPEDPSERLAKTGYSLDFPIFFNLNLLHELNAFNNFTLLLPTLIHEIGHQLLFSDHHALDRIGAKIQKFTKTVNQSLTTSSPSIPLKVQLINHFSPYYEADLFFYNSEFRKTLRIGAKDISEQCPLHSEPLGLKLENIYWEKRPSYNRSKEIRNIHLKAWATLLCRSESNQTILHIERNLDLKASSLNNISKSNLKFSIPNQQEGP